METGTDGDTTTGGVDTWGEVDCGGEPLVLPGEGLCTVSAPGTTGLSLPRHGLAPRRSTPAVGCWWSTTRSSASAADCANDPQAADASVVDCADGVISPGLISTHDHLGFTNNVPIGQGPDQRAPPQTGARGPERPRQDHDRRERETNGRSRRASSASSSAARPRRSAAAAGARGSSATSTRRTTRGGAAGPDRRLRHLPARRLRGIQLENGCNYGPNPTTAADYRRSRLLPPAHRRGDQQGGEERVPLHEHGRRRRRRVAERDRLTRSPSTSLDIVEVFSEQAKVIWSPRSNVVLYGNTAAVTAMDQLGVLDRPRAPTGSGRAR